jgi:hypothetical protein
MLNFSPAMKIVCTILHAQVVKTGACNLAPYMALERLGIDRGRMPGKDQQTAFVKEEIKCLRTNQ